MNLIRSDGTLKTMQEMSDEALVKSNAQSQTASLRQSAFAQTEIAKKNNEMVAATYEMVKAQQVANEQQKETNVILENQCKELQRKNEAYEKDLKSTNKRFWISTIISIVSGVVAIASVIVAVIAIVK